MLSASVASRFPPSLACLRIFPSWSVPLENPSIKIKPHTPKLFSSFRIHCHSNLPMPPKALKFVVEYAKSGRSTCKSCSEIITAKSLRIGSVTRDERGFDMTKWHHVNCFGLGSKSIDSAGSIQGFDSLKAADQDALAKLLEKHDEAKKGVSMSNDQTENQKEEHTGKKQKAADRDALAKLLEKHDEAKKEVSMSKDQTENQQEGHTGKKRKAADQDALLKLLDKHDEAKKVAPVTSVDALVKIVLSMSDIEDKYKDVTLPPRWKAFRTIIFLDRDDGLKDSNKIAAFDFDGCLVKTSVKRIGANAWSLMYPSIPDKLQKLYNDGYKLVIFTNESNIDRWKNKRQVAVESKIGRLDQFIQRVKVPMQVFIACGYDKPSGETDPFRKPKPGMWHIMEKHFNSGIQVDMDESFYVGDAAGREKDHSDADIKFAQAIGLKFYLPEDYLKVYEVERHRCLAGFWPLFCAHRTNGAGVMGSRVPWVF